MAGYPIAFQTSIYKNGGTAMGLIAAVLFAIAYFIRGSDTSTNIWLDPTSLMLLGLVALALHLLGVGEKWVASGRSRYSRRR